MKILLTAINAKYIHSNLAVYSLKASSGRYRDDVEIAEYTINNYIDEILSSIYIKKPDLIAFSCYIWNIDMVLELIDLFHKVAGDVPVWVGGPEVSYDARAVLEKNPGITGVMCGEGEATFRELLACYEETFGGDLRAGNVMDFWKRLEQVQGLVFRSWDQTIVATGERPPLAMDDLPFPYEDLKAFDHKIIYYESSRGCPFRCSYCLSSIDKRVRFRSTELVKKELQLFLDARVEQVKFVDRTFNCSHSHTLDIWRFIRDHDNGVTNFHFEISADLLNEEELKFLADLRPGLVQLEIGVQSTNRQTIEAIDRTMDFEALSGIVSRIQEAHNVHQHLDLIAGLPYEDLESFKKSFNDVYRLRPQQLQMGFLKVLKGSKMHRVQKSYDLVYRTKPVYEVMSTRWLSFDDVLALKQIEEMVELYYNSTQFFNTLDYFLHFFNTPYEMFETLAHWYSRTTTDGASHSRLARYGILEEFAKTEGKRRGIDLKAARSVLVYDLYLRENVKNRPDWAWKESDYKDDVAAFYSDPAKRQQYLSGHDGESYRQVRHQTHLERFEIDVAAAVKRGETLDKEQWILFDYTKRDPLTYEAWRQIL